MYVYISLDHEFQTGKHMLFKPFTANVNCIQGFAILLVIHFPQWIVISTAGAGHAYFDGCQIVAVSFFAEFPFDFAVLFLT